MNTVVPGHKIEVFISSKCGGQYSIVRKSLKCLLENTGLANVYAFETEPASSQDAISAYLEYVDRSDVVIFIVDNGDGPSEPVLSEHKRAKDKNLRLLYVFCDENSKKETVMQKELKVSFTQKYCISHEFSDIPAKAYESFLQDIINVYKHKYAKELVESAQNATIEKSNQNADNLVIKKEKFSDCLPVQIAVSDGIIQQSDKKEDFSMLENLLGKYARHVIRKESFDEESFLRLKKEIIDIQDDKLTDVLEKRFEAQKCFVEAKYTKCNVLLKEALKLAADNVDIPVWLANDIAIDIRHVQSCIDEKKNRITIRNYGQKYIDKSSEPIYYPILDREIEHLNEKLIKLFDEKENTSPYTVRYGGALFEVFKPLAKAFSVAELYGSIVQTELLRARLIDIYSMLCTLYCNHNFLIEYLRLLVIEKKQKQIRNILRMYNYSSIINVDDVNCILESTRHINNINHKNEARLIVAGSLAYYMDDDSFSSLEKELFKYLNKWVNNDKRIIDVWHYIKIFLEGSLYRIALDATIAFIKEIFRHEFSRFYYDCYRILGLIDYESLSITSQKEVLALLLSSLDIVSKEDLFQIRRWIITFCANTVLDTKIVEEQIATLWPEFYEEDFGLIMCERRDVSPVNYIAKFIKDAENHNSKQGKDGIHYGLSYEPLETIDAIIRDDSVQLSEETLCCVLDVLMQTLNSQGQTVGSKIAAISGIYDLHERYSQNEAWNKIREDLLTNQQQYSCGYEMHKDSNALLSLLYIILLNRFGVKNDEEIIEWLFAMDNDDSYEIIKVLQFLSDRIVNLSTSESGVLLVSYLHFAIGMSRHKEKDVQFFAEKLIMSLTKYSNTRSLALKHLLGTMNSGNPEIKRAIIYQIKQIDSDDDYAEEIIETGKIDTHYLVRKAANEI